MINNECHEAWAGNDEVKTVLEDPLDDDIANNDIFSMKIPTLDLTSGFFFYDRLESLHHFTDEDCCQEGVHQALLHLVTFLMVLLNPSSQGGLGDQLTLVIIMRG